MSIGHTRTVVTHHQHCLSHTPPLRMDLWHPWLLYLVFSLTGQYDWSFREMHFKKRENNVWVVVRFVDRGDADSISLFK
jgi:hypothetical protein